MGYAMASNMRRKTPPDSTFYVNDVNRAACDRFQKEFASFGPIEFVSTAREAAENAKVIVSIVPGGLDVKNVYLDSQNGVIAAKKDLHRLMLECSTIDVETTKEVGKTLAEAGVGTYIDAPVSVSQHLSRLISRR